DRAEAANALAALRIGHGLSQGAVKPGAVYFTLQISLVAGGRFWISRSWINRAGIGHRRAGTLLRSHGLAHQFVRRAIGRARASAPRLLVDAAAPAVVLVYMDFGDDGATLALGVEPQAQHQPLLLPLVPIVELGAGVHDRVVVEEGRLARFEPGLELQPLSGRAERVDRLDLFHREGALQLAERG